MTETDPVQIKDQNGRQPYRLRENFLSTPELALFRVLQAMAGRHYGTPHAVFRLTPGDLVNMSGGQLAVIKLEV